MHPEEAPLEHPELFEFSDYDGRIVDRCDYLVIGSGPGGAMVARRLSETGKKVILVEAGPVARARDYKREAGHLMTRFFWDGGMRSTRGNAFMPTLHAKVLGGGSVFNSAICLRAPTWQLKRWESQHGLLGFSDGLLDDYYQRVEDFLGVQPVHPAVQGRSNKLFGQAAAQLGWDAQVIQRNEQGCDGSGQCMTGCPSRAKKSVDIRGVPSVLENGGRVYTSVVIDKLIVKGRRVQGAVGHVLDPITGKRRWSVKIHAKATILSAGPMANPAIVQRSGIKRPQVGQNLRFHPGTALTGRFEDDVTPWFGATQGMHILDFLEDDGYKLETLWALPALLAFRFPGMGTEFKGLLKDYRKMAVWDLWVSGEDSVGRVRANPIGSRADYVYDMGQRDVDRMKNGMAALVELFFAAGAREVMLGTRGLPAVATDASAADLIRKGDFTPADLIVASNHVFGSMAMGADRDRHVCDPSGTVYDVDDLYVADTSMMPGSPGANPMLTAMALSLRVGDTLAMRY